VTLAALQPPVPVQGDLLVDGVRLAALTVLSGLLGVGMGALHRWYADRRVPDGLPVLIGLSGVAVYLNTAGALGDVILGDVDLLAFETVVFNVVVLAVAAVAADLGGRGGDRLGVSVFAVSGAHRVDRDVSRIVQTVGRVITVELPDEIADIDGYDPVDPATKADLAGQQLVFPRGLTVEALRSRLIERLRTDYGVGHVDVDLAGDGAVEYLALGSRAAGIGPTLPPGHAVVAIRADPPNGASPGDAVQVWTTGDGARERVTTAELRGTADDVATVAVDEADVERLDPATRYRLVTLPVEARVDREFAAQLRAAAETMGVVTVREGSPLTGTTVGSLDVAVVAVRPAEGSVEAIPARSRQLSAGETVYVVARPDRLRTFETAAGGPESAPAP